MKKSLIAFIILAVFTAGGAVWIGYDTAKLRNGDYIADTREYEPVSQENKTVSDSKNDMKTNSEKAVSANSDNNVVCYKLKAEYGYVVIYNPDGTLYDKSDIRLASLPRTLQIEILNGKDLFSQKELYNFLETYST